MRLLRRRPREVYRVYSEEEYLGGAGSELIGDIGEWPVQEPDLAIDLEWPIDRSPVSVEAAGQVDGQRGLQRAAGVAMLAGAVGAVSCLVFLNIARSHGGGGARGGVVAATHPAPIVRAAAVADAQPEVALSRPAVVRAVETNGSHALPIRRSPVNPVSSRPTHLLTHLPVRRQIDVAAVADYVPRPSSGAVAEASVSIPASTATASVGATPASPPAEKRPEFGFER